MLQCELTLELKHLSHAFGSGIIPNNAKEINRINDMVHKC